MQKQTYEEWREEIRKLAKDLDWHGDPCDDVEESQNLEAYNDGMDADTYLYEGWINP